MPSSCEATDPDQKLAEFNRCSLIDRCCFQTSLSYLPNIDFFDRGSLDYMANIDLFTNIDFEIGFDTNGTSYITVSVST